MVAEPCLGGAPVRDGEAVCGAGGLDLGLVPVHVERGVALEVEGLPV